VHVTPGDWRITAVQEADRSVAGFREAHETSRDPAGILAAYWRAFRAAEAALGAAVESELAAGMTIADVRAACAVSGPDDETRLDRAREVGTDRLQARLNP
jgi:hypothetical protein